jgi:dihydroorotate dehydrogenase (fumarate)
MTDLSVKVMGLELKNPLIVGSCGFTDSVENIKKLEEAGAGAVVLKSLFEEQIMNKISDTIGELNQIYSHPEISEYLSFFEEKNIVDNYLQLIKDAKQAVSIPVIASINCGTFDKWIKFSAEIEKAGADALEINLYLLPSDPKVSEHKYLETAMEITKGLKKHISIPFSLKLGSYSDTLAKDLLTLSRTDASALVLFNRPFNPDIDTEKETIVSGYSYSTPNEISKSLRWIAIASDFVETDLIATTGVHCGKGIVKQILAGAKAVEMVSALYMNSFNTIEHALNDLKSWMEEHGYKKLSDFRGKLSRKDHALFDRVQFLKHS